MTEALNQSHLTPTMENQMEKNMENEMDMGIIWGFIGIRALYELWSKLRKGGCIGDHVGEYY